jgi:4-amino-4-deoxy-L-arabinose transferase-like glycosyltransferase
LCTASFFANESGLNYHSGQFHGRKVPWSERSLRARNGSRVVVLKKISIAALFLLAGGALFFRAGSGSFLNHDEITYLQMAREMLSSGNWLDLQFQGVVVHQRPPLAIWLLALSRAALGAGLLASRLPSISMGLLSLLGLFLVARRLYSDRTAFLAVGLTAATMLFYFNARRPMTDTTFLAGMLFFFYFYLQAKEKPAFWPAAGAAAGWMLMSKGALSALPLGTALLDYLLAPRGKRGPLVAAGTALLLATPWHVAEWVRHGNAFWTEYIGFNVLQRAGGSLFTSSEPLFYLRELWSNEGLLLPLFFGGLAAVVWRYVKRREAADRFLLLWLGVLLVPLQLSSTRIYHYLLPVLPVLALTAASMLAPLLEKRLLQAGAAMAVLGLFFVSNSHHLLTPDYSPDQLRFARLIASPRPTTVVALNTYELSLFYYLGEPVRMITDNQHFFDVVDSAPILHRTDSVKLLTRSQLAALPQKGPFHCITTPEHLPLLCGHDGALCAPEGPLRVVEGQILTLVSRGR